MFRLLHGHPTNSCQSPLFAQRSHCVAQQVVEEGGVHKLIALLQLQVLAKAAPLHEGLKAGKQHLH